MIKCNPNRKPNEYSTVLLLISIIIESGERIFPISKPKIIVKIK